VKILRNRFDEVDPDKKDKENIRAIAASTNEFIKQSCYSKIASFIWANENLRY